MQDRRQSQFDYPALERSGEDRRERLEEARSIAAQLAAVPHELVACGPERWDQARRFLPLLVACDSASEAARRAGLSPHQVKRVREAIVRLRLVTVRPQFERLTRRRIEDRIEIDRERIAELAALAREERRVRCRAPGAHLQGTYSAPAAQVQRTWSAPAAHPDEGACIDNARAPAPARVRSDNDTIRSIDRSIDRSIEQVQEWGEEDWERVRDRVRPLVRKPAFRDWGPVDIRQLVEYALLVELGILPESWLSGIAGDVADRPGVNAPYKYLRTCLRKAAEEQGVPFHAAVSQISPHIPEWMLRPRAKVEAVT